MTRTPTRPLAAEHPLWQIDICNLREAVTQHPPDGECRGGTQSIKHGLFRNNHFDVGAEDSFEAYWLKGSKCSIVHDAYNHIITADTVHVEYRAVSGHISFSSVCQSTEASQFYAERAGQ